jgi:spore maturation protein CgeB/predicted O-methyltransferase YrrM
MKTLTDFKNIHKGSEVIVCGCGESLRDLAHPERFTTVGVNDVGRLFHPTYLVVVNPRRQFAGDRFRYVEASQAKYLFTQLDLGIPYPNIVKFKLGTYGGTNGSDPNALHYTQNSPYVALCLAAHMGAKRIGLIGVDFTDNHFFGKTGRHVLAHQLPQIDAEYRKLRESLAQRGIEVVNLSGTSRLTSIPKMTIDAFASLTTERIADDDGQAVGKDRSRIFFVHYRFLACGDVFTTGLRNAAEELGLLHEHAGWDDPALPEKVRSFKPDLLFVVHGRRFVQKWGVRFQDLNTAVWLLDEPYEVDDTSSWSAIFKTVFINDPVTLHRHKNAHYLPVCFDPRLHRNGIHDRKYKVGFIGGYNETRERSLVALAREGLLSYVVGGPWRDPSLKKLSLGGNVPPEQTAELYRQTQVVVNVFRDIHHYNRSHIEGWSMNPRVYEALACGAIVVSEPRPEVAKEFPEIPVFCTPEQLKAKVSELLSNEPLRAERIARGRMTEHTYAARLKRVLEATLAAPAFDVAGRKEGVFTSSPIERSTAREHRCEGMDGSLSCGTRPHREEPFSEMPIRNLMYHIWPVKGSSWRLNVEELLKRIDIFNGRRIISIVHDARSDDPVAVQRTLAGHGCEFLIAPNDPKGEAAVFPRLLDKVKETDASALTFYGHAKGVKYGTNLSRPVRKWLQTLYRVNLDDWVAVKGQLKRYQMTGAFKMRGRFASHRYLGEWHYSGTFFWFKNSAVFSRNYRNVPEFYCGVEAWPGLMFSDQETGCLFLDGVRQIAYLDRFWRETGDLELTRWESHMHGVAPPADLARPVSYDGYEWPRLEQVPQEFDWWIGILRTAGVRRLLTIGSGYGGVEWHVARKFREQGRDIEITAVDISDRPEIGIALEDARSRFGQKIKFLQGDSTCQAMRERLAGQYDAVFIDSDHSYRAVASDFQLALSRKPRVIGLHDIVDSDWHASARCCVSRLWAELTKEYRTEERQTANWGGIGVVWPGERKAASLLTPDTVVGA